MAQAGLRSFYPVRRRREDDTQTAVKRRKLTESSHLEVSSNQLDSTLVHDQHKKSIDDVTSTTVKKPATRSRKTGNRSTTTKQGQSGRGKRTKRGAKTTSMDVPSIKTLFEIVNKTTSVNDEAPIAGTMTTVGDKPSDEYPLPETCSKSRSQLEVAASHHGRKNSRETKTTPCPSPFKTPATPPKDSRSRTSTPKSSPVKAASSPAPLCSSTHPITSSPIPESRGARLLRMAKEKMSTKSPVSKVASAAGTNDLSLPSVTEKRTTRIAARRKLLVNPDLPSTSSSKSATKFFPSKEQDRQEIVGELHKLSRKELAQPTRYESAKVKRRKEVEKEEEGSSTRTPKLREFGVFEFVSPTKNEVAKSRLPAYQKFHALAQVAPPIATPTPEAPLPPPPIPVELPLPYSYQLLEEKFRCTDTVVSMLQKRKEICTFEKLKTAVQEMSRRQFEEKNLGQMKTVYPTAFNFRQEKHIPGHYDNKQRNKYHLTVECRLGDEEENGGRMDSNIVEMKKRETKSVTSALNATTLIKRRKKFNHNLTEIAKKHHKAFLASLCPPLHIPDDKILRWHPAFALDLVPEIEVAQLPVPPIKETYTTAKDVLNATQDHLAERVKAALASARESSEAGEGERVVKREETNHVTNNPELKGVSAALLEKVRAKEAAKAKLTITRDPVKERQLEMLSRLPDFVRIVRGFFVTERKAALLREDVVKKLVDSHPSRLPADKVESHLQYLLEVLPEWIKSVKVSKGIFIKVDKQADLKTIMEKLERTKSVLARQN